MRDLSEGPRAGTHGPQAANPLFSTAHTFLDASSFWGARRQEDLHSSGLLFFFVFFFCLDLKILESLTARAQPILFTLLVGFNDSLIIHKPTTQNNK